MLFVPGLLNFKVLAFVTSQYVLYPEKAYTSPFPVVLKGKTVSAPPIVVL